MARRLLFTDELPDATRRRYGGAIAAMSREAAFSGWEAEAADTPTDPAEVSAGLADVAAQYIDRLLASTGPRVVVIDDLQWLDPSSEGMVDLVVDRCAHHPLIVLAAARPGPLPNWTSRDDIDRIRLGGLDEPETARLATIVARAAVDADGARSIHERTGGNPLFVGETVRAFLEDGTLQWRDGLVAMTGMGGSRVPITLRAILGARIDALAPAARDALGVASIVGITFRPAVVEELLDAPVEPEVFEHLAASSLVFPLDDDRWRFAHSLIHDAAYAGLLASRRRVLHARLADRLERGPDTTTPGQIAVHRVAAGDAVRAIPLLREAAESALGLGAVTEAAAYWGQAAELADADDPDAAALDRARADEALATLEALREAVAPGSARGEPV
jgi:predicted ATPase